MSRTSILRILLTIVLMLSSQAVKAQSASSEQTAKALHELFETEWEYQLREDPLSASFMGDRRWNDKWPDATLEAIAKRQEHDKDVLVRLKAIDRDKLPPPDQLNYDLFKKNYESNIEAQPFR